MAIKWEPPSEEELAARGIVVAPVKERDHSDSGDEVRAKKPRRKKEG